MDEICINSTGKYEKITSVVRVEVEQQGLELSKNPIYGYQPHDNHFKMDFYKKSQKNNRCTKFNSTIQYRS